MREIYFDAIYDKDEKKCNNCNEIKMCYEFNNEYWLCINECFKKRWQLFDEQMKGGDE